MTFNCLNIKKGSLICLFFVLGLWSCNPNQARLTRIEGDALGTTYHVTYDGKTSWKDIKEGFDSILVEVNAGLSTYQEQSIISAYNRGQLDQALVDANNWATELNYFKHMVELSKHICTSTEGAFDPGAASLFQVYSEAKQGRLPLDTTRIDSMLPHTGIMRVHEVLTSSAKHEHLQLNFNAIAKGYTVDLFAEYLEDLGINNYLVEIGGEVRVKGSKQGEPWVLGINTPVENSGVHDLYDGIELSAGAMATSGNYQNFYYVGDKLIGHTFDPRTGRPVTSDLKSATIFHPECAIADAYATACMVMGLEEATALVKQDSSLSAYFIYELQGAFKSRKVE